MARLFPSLMLVTGALLPLLGIAQPTKQGAAIEQAHVFAPAELVENPSQPSN